MVASCPLTLSPKWDKSGTKRWSSLQIGRIRPRQTVRITKVGASLTLTLAWITNNREIRYRISSRATLNPSIICYLWIRARSICWAPPQRLWQRPRYPREARSRVWSSLGISPRLNTARVRTDCKGVIVSRSSSEWWASPISPPVMRSSEG